MKRKRKLRWLLIAAAIFIGIICMLYPFISNYVFEHRKDSLVNSYEQQAESADEQQKAALLEKAQEYNEAIFTGHVQLHDPFSEEVIGQSKEDYLAQLSIDGSDIMGYVEIPCIDVSLPIYHGTSAETLQKGVGHLEGTSLPVGGENTHCVLTGHTGLNSAKMFTDLTQMVEGDLFFLNVLGDKLCYRVDQIKVIEPAELSDLTIDAGKDYCTLITCTPYGVNSHRLLVRGERAEYTEEEETAEIEVRTSGSQWMQEYIRALICASVCIAVSLSVILVIRQRKRRKKNAKKQTPGVRVGSGHGVEPGSDRSRKHRRL